MRVGFIGLGSQGGPMAKAIIDHGFPVVLWARRAETLASFGRRVRIAGSPAELAGASDLVGVCVLADSDVEEVVLGSRGLREGLRAGAVLAIHSTVHPDTCRRIAQALEPRGVEVLDAPVSGGGPAAAAGSLLVMVGGQTSALEHVRPVLATFGDPIIHVGPLGAGQIAKLTNNLLFTDNLALAHLAVELGTALGLDRTALVDILQHGSSRSFALGVFSGARRGYGEPGSPAVAMAALLQKDVNLLHDLVQGHGVDPELLLAVAGAGLGAMRGGAG